MNTHHAKMSTLLLWLFPALCVCVLGIAFVGVGPVYEVTQMTHE